MCILVLFYRFGEMVPYAKVDEISDVGMNRREKRRKGQKGD